MKIFISHASKNKEIVLKFASFLESIGTEVEVFCTSEKGAIATGKNFIETIAKELNTCDLFIPVLSQEYYESRFCMIELGVAYSYMYNKYKQNEEYIFPFVLYPIKKEDALAGTPLADIEVGEINSETDLKAFLMYLSDERKISIGLGMNKKIHSFVVEIERMLLEKIDIWEQARIGTYFDDDTFFRSKEDIVKHIVQDESVTIDFCMNPYEKTEDEYPKFISMVLSYIDKLDIGQCLLDNPSAKFGFVLKNLTDSLKKITVEFKYSDNNRILETFEFPINAGDNVLSIPLEKMRSRALHSISEICFVIHPEDTNRTEGTFCICKMEIA